ncbi:MAG: hypothetical protein GWO16_01515 [Gammaproteobacteria bacterium]|nr:hypothetical protein [Gammaproteobacteria bacterium]NIR96809.1 hypothetical protein [Gammaproteobacteria bacterium]NIT62509.1 hypothetical protein [Gammaproteobacteria bacterium]NIV19449.1 hypothetical protein [Gammaproteobacteria bacterium]NIX10532.1 hypothetical protein [Gammaproteobacteria bacterium]
MAEQHTEAHEHPIAEQEIEQQADDRPAAPLAGVVYGDAVYWGTIAAAALTLIGEVLNFVTSRNYIAPSYLLSSIWQGKDVDNIWGKAVGAAPNGHWYLDHLGTGDGLTTAGIALGVFVVVPAILASAAVLYRQRQALFASLAVIAALVTIGAMIA